MENRATNVPPRTKVRLNSEQSSVLKEYLIRTTLLWNLLHQHMKVEAEAYMAAPPVAESDRAFRHGAEMLYRKILNKDVPYATSGLLPAWEDYIGKIRELSPSLIRNRLDDLLDAYELAKRDLTNGSERPTGPPHRKNDKSSQSVRFSSDEFSVKNGKVSITSVFPFEFDVPEFNNVVLTPDYKLSITRRRLVDQQQNIYGPTDDSQETYMVTLR